MKTKSPLPWFGSDAGVAPQLAAMLDDCKHVTIPFAGGMSILPHLKAKAVVANDLHKYAIDFYDVAKDVYGTSHELKLKCNDTLSHPEHLEYALRCIDDIESEDLTLRAWAFWATCWIGRKGKGGTKNQGGKPSVRRTANGGNNATRIRSAAADLESWAEEFKRCEFTCEDFRECLLKIADRPDCGIYVDPPWFGAGDGYLHSFTEEDHRNLAYDLARFKESRIVIRYGDAPLVRELYSCCTITEATSRTQANNSLGELWITINVEVSS